MTVRRITRTVRRVNATVSSLQSIAKGTVDMVEVSPGVYAPAPLPRPVRALQRTARDVNDLVGELRALEASLRGT